MLSVYLLLPKHVHNTISSPQRSRLMPILATRRITHCKGIFMAIRTVDFMCAFALTALISAPAFAQDEDFSDKVAQAEEDIKNIASSDCAAEVRKCGGNVFAAMKSGRKECTKLRGCKKTCRGAKKTARKSSGKTKRQCLKACGSKKGKARRTCKKNCRKSKRGAVKNTRGARKMCVVDCRKKFKTAGCKKARMGFLKDLFKCAKTVITNEDCQKKVQAAAENMQKATAADGG